jgi:hypothetical protein
MRKLKALSGDNERAAASSHAAYAWAVLAYRAHEEINFTALLRCFDGPLQGEPGKFSRKPALKGLTFIGTHMPILRERCSESLVRFFTGSSKQNRDRAYYCHISSLLNWRESDDQIEKAVPYGLGHIEFRIKRGIFLLRRVIKALCLVAMKRDAFRTEIYGQFRILLATRTASESADGVLPCVLDSEPLPNESRHAQPFDRDIFDGCEVAAEIWDDAQMIYEWKQTRALVGVLYQVDLGVPDVGNAPPTDWVSHQEG